jgi:hypothetical protein
MQPRVVQLPLPQTLAHMYHRHFQRLAEEQGRPIIGWGALDDVDKDLRIAVCQAVMDELADYNEVNPNSTPTEEPSDAQL